MIRYMLDTNAVTQLLKNHPMVVQRARTVPISSLCISALTKGELLYGLAKRPQAHRLRNAVNELLNCLDVLPWENAVAEHYGNCRAALERQGKSLAPLDLMIASHAQSINATLVTNDQTFIWLEGLKVQDWSENVPQ